ncbi:MAG: hypothetical protein JWL59_3299 [Chthoniobacteraceae bacterium]|nr:hypothetical protein [Chthoniobacteraceae bacterium]
MLMLNTGVAILIGVITIAEKLSGHWSKLSPNVSGEPRSISYFGAGFRYLLALLCPLLGFILWLFCRRKPLDGDRRVARRLKRVTIASWIINGILVFAMEL